MTGRQYSYIINGLLTCLVCVGLSIESWSQEAEAPDSVSIAAVAPVQVDSTGTRKFISGLEFQIDYGKLLLAWTSFETKFEAGINIRFWEQLVLVGEFGIADLNPLKAYDNALYYNVQGSWFRTGLDYYTSYNPKSFYYAGLRYATSTFSDEGKFLIESEFWEDYQEEFGSSGVTASWVEIVLGTEGFLKLGKSSKPDTKNRLMIGWTGRLRILTDFTNRPEPVIYAIPGYGRTFNKAVPALNFYVKYRLGS